MTKNMSWTGTHPAVDLWAEARQERDEWQARAEAAENKMWEAVTQAANEIVMWQEKLEAAEREREDWQTRAEAAEKRVAELEAQLAWRPVTEPPTEKGNYHVWRHPGYHDFCHFNGVNWRTTGGDSVTHWQPLSDPPAHPTPSNSMGLAATE